MVKKPNGETRTEYRAPTGRIEKEQVRKPDGTQQTTQYDPSGRVRKTEVINKDNTLEVTTHQAGRNGKTRAEETIKYDRGGNAVSKTVVVKQTTVIARNTTIINNNTTIVNNTRSYNRGHYGFVYHPVYVARYPLFVSWYDPYWYSPAGVVIMHPFHYSWEWEGYGWYRYHSYYWANYPVYPAPSYWVTDWLVASYVADRYEASASAAQAREDARLAREEAEQARGAAEKAQDEAEKAELRAALSNAEQRAAAAEANRAKAEAAEAKATAQAGKPNPNATPIDKETKETLRTQVEQTIAENKQLAEQAEKGGNPVVPDLSKALADPKHIYPVSKTVSVISAKDQAPAGTVTEGDLLRLEPGQDLKEANENTFVTMRVMSSKGEEGEVAAGTLISVPLRDLQEFDSEFRAKLDLGLAEAAKNKDLFKQGAVKQ